MSPLLRSARLTLRPITERDIVPIARILAEPEVERWWGEHDAERIRTELIDDEEVETFAIDVDGDLAGILLVSEEDEPDYRHAGLDITLATEYHGQGLGREALRLVIDHLIDERGHHRFTIDPDTENERAIRCYRAVGFRPVGVMRKCARLHGSDEWRDGLLMDLLAEDL